MSQSQPKLPTLPAMPAEVAKVFADYPPAMRKRLMRLRKMVFETAASEGVGPLTETLKWGEPAYLTNASRSGSTIRMAWKGKKPDQYALYFNCNSSLVGSFRRAFDGELSFEENRAIVFTGNEPLPVDTVRACLAMALTYHRDK